MATKAEKITELLVVISNKSGRIKKLKLECGKQSTQICVLNLRIQEFEAARDDAIAHIEWVRRDLNDGRGADHERGKLLSIIKSLKGK